MHMNKVKIIIEYTINYEAYIRRMFPTDIYDELADDMLNKTKLKHIIYSQIGYDEHTGGKTYHVADQYKICNADTGQYLYCDNPIIDYTMKQLFQMCDDHYITRDEKKLLENGISWEIRQTDISEEDKKEGQKNNE